VSEGVKSSAKSGKDFAGSRSNPVLLGLGIASVVLFLLLAANVASGGVLVLLDARLSVWLHNHNTPARTTFFLLISNLHSNLSIAIVTFLVAVYLWTRHLRYWVLTLAISIPGGGLLNVGLKILFARARPHFDNPILIVHTYSFPSGHTMLATVFYGTLCILIYSLVRDWKLRMAALLVALLMITLVGFSRMYLGVHYLTDVVGAILEGTVWLVLCFLTLGTLQRRHARTVRNIPMATE
jgi:undecaprenyl-diphosphatase